MDSPYSRARELLGSKGQRVNGSINGGSQIIWRECVVCRRTFGARRRDARFCGGACRQMVSRRIRRLRDEGKREEAARFEASFRR